MRPSELRLFVLCLAWLFTVLMLVLSWPLVAGADELQVYPDPTPQRTDGSPWVLAVVAGVCLAGWVVWKVVTTCDDSEADD